MRKCQDRELLFRVGQALCRQRLFQLTDLNASCGEANSDAGEGAVWLTLLNALELACGGRQPLEQLFNEVRNDLICPSLLQAFWIRLEDWRGSFSQSQEVLCWAIQYA